MDKKTIIEKVKNAGVVGAGGGGFPTHVKISADVDTLIANGAECEPLLSTDRYLLRTKAEEIIEGLRLVQQTTGAKNVYIALKRKYKKAVLELNKILGKATDIKIFLLDNYYPAGDEFDIVYNVTGKIIPEGGLPLDVGTVVINVNTLLNIYYALYENRVVTKRWVTVCGEVEEPYIAEVPLGISAKELIDAANPKILDYKIIAGGPMMGKIVEESFSITKLCGGIIVLSEDSPVVIKQSLRIEVHKKRGKSMCDQCFDCTIVCPRSLLGHDLEPHKIMRNLFIAPENSYEHLTNAYLCCECGLCDMFACPLDLSPRNLLREAKEQLNKKGIINSHKRENLTVHPEMEFRKVNADKLMSRIGVKEYDIDEFEIKEIRTNKVVIPLSQSAGKTSSPVVKIGEKVKVGDIVADIPNMSLGAKIHSSIEGNVDSVGTENIVIKV